MCGRLYLDGEGESGEHPRSLRHRAQSSDVGHPGAHQTTRPRMKGSPLQPISGRSQTRGVATFRLSSPPTDSMMTRNWGSSVRSVPVYGAADSPRPTSFARNSATHSHLFQQGSRPSMSMLDRPCKPKRGPTARHRNAIAIQVGQAEVKLCLGISCVRRPPIPEDGGSIIDRDTLAFVIAVAQIPLCCRIPGQRCLCKPVDGRLQISGHPNPFAKSKSKVILGLGVPIIGGEAIPFHRLLKVLVDTPPEIVASAEVELRPSNVQCGRPLPQFDHGAPVGRARSFSTKCKTVSQAEKSICVPLLGTPTQEACGFHQVVPRPEFTERCYPRRLSDRSSSARLQSLRRHGRRQRERRRRRATRLGLEHAKPRTLSRMQSNPRSQRPE